MRTGWEIVIAGENFDPTEFLKSSQLQPCQSWKREVEGERGRCMQYGIEFTDWHEGPYPLDMATEALDYLLDRREEFKKLCNLPGVEERYLNFVDTLSGHGGSFDFEPGQLAILAELNFSMTISIV